MGVVWTFFLSSITSLLSPSLWETARYRLKYCLKGPLNPEQPTNQLTIVMSRRSVNLTTLFLGSFIPPKRLTSTSCKYFDQYLTNVILESAEGEMKVCGRRTGYLQQCSPTAIRLFLRAEESHYDENSQKHT